MDEKLRLLLAILAGFLLGYLWFGTEGFHPHLAAGRYPPGIPYCEKHPCPPNPWLQAKQRGEL